MKTLVLQILFGVIAVNLIPDSIGLAFQVGEKSRRVVVVGRSISIDQVATNSELYEEYKAEWLRGADRRGRLTLAEHESLWNKNIKLEILDSKPVDSVKLDFVGLDSSRYVSSKMPKLLRQVSKASKAFRWNEFGRGDYLVSTRSTFGGFGLSAIKSPETTAQQADAECHRTF
jgi:hypothetical protein